MKKTILAITFCLFTLNCFCQTITYNDIMALFNKTKTEDMLLKKGFVLDNFRGTKIYKLNSRTDKEEQVIYSERGVDYWSLDKAYIATFVKPVQAQFKLIYKDPDVNGESMYEYGNPKITVTVSVQNHPRTFSMVTVMRH